MGKKKKFLKLLITVMLLCLTMATMTSYAESKQVCPTCWEADNKVENTIIIQNADKTIWECSKNHEFETPKTITPKTDAEKETDPASKMMEGFLRAMLSVVFGNPINTSENTAGNVLDPWTMLKNSTEVVFVSLDELVTSDLYSVFQALGIILLTIYFIMDLASHDTFTAFGNKPTVEQFLKPFIKYLLCVLFVCNVQWIMYFLLGISQGAFNHSLNTLTITNTGMSADMIDIALEIAGWKPSEGFWEGLIAVHKNLALFLPIFFTFLIPWLISTACNFMLVYVILSRIVQIVVQGVIAPIAMSDIYSSEGKFRETRAWGFIRNFAALCFQSLVIVLILYVVNALIGTYMTQLTESLAPSGNWTNEFVNAASLSNLAVQMSVLKCVQVGTVMGSAAEAKKLFNGG